MEGHEKGVRSLAYNSDHRFMVSGGFDYDALVWNPYVERLILRLHGHNAPLVGVEMVPNTPQKEDPTGVIRFSIQQPTEDVKTKKPGCDPLDTGCISKFRSFKDLDYCLQSGLPRANCPVCTTTTRIPCRFCTTLVFGYFSYIVLISFAVVPVKALISY